MIIARSPLRVSFTGGGTDIPQFYERYGPGAVVSTTINKYVYVSLSEKFGGGISLRYRVHENKERADQLDHPLVREMLNHYGVTGGIELVITSDVPARGSGLGASSALACALAAILEYYTGREVTDKEAIAKVASDVEISKVGSPIGKQDHYSSAFGGLNFILFQKDGSVSVERFASEDFIGELESQSMLFYLDIQHKYLDERGNQKKDTHFVQKILKEQVVEIDSKRRIYELQRDNAIALWEHMRYEVPERFIDHVNENWRLKRSLHPEISNAEIDAIIQKAYSAGATAAKVCGAGGGGFLYLMVPPYMQGEVRKALEGLKELKFMFEKKGVEVVFDDTEKEPCGAH